MATINARIWPRRDTAANWTSVNPVLAVGEIGYETDTAKWKLGDGTATWTALAYQVEDTIANGVVNRAPSQNAVFDALALKAPIDAPAFTGIPTALTASVGTNTPQIATTAFVQQATPDATTTAKGKVQLAGDLAGTAAAPTVPHAAKRAQIARNPDLIIVGTVTRDSNGAATSAPVAWPDGSPGTYTALVLSSAFPGAVDSYSITYGSPVTKTYTQPTVTRDASGAVTQLPAIVES